MKKLFSSITLSVSNPNYTASTPHPTLKIYLGSTSGIFISKYTSEEIAKAMHLYLVSRLSSTSSTTIPEPKSTHVTSWLKNPFSLGAKSSPIALTTRAGEEESTPLDFITLGRDTWQGRLGFAGEHTDLDNRGSIVGGYISGIREGKRVESVLKSLDREL